MSSSISGIFELLDDFAEKIRQQSLAELSQAQKELREITLELNLNEHKNTLDVRRKKEREEKYVASEAQLQMIASMAEEEKTNRLALMTTEALAYLEYATNQLETCEEDFEEKTIVLTQIAFERNAIETNGITNQLYGYAKQLALETVPQLIKEIQKSRKSQKLEAMHSVKNTEDNNDNNSMPFVSLRIEPKKKEEMVRPWILFVNRIKALAILQETYGGTEAQKLLEESSTVAASAENRFIAMHYQELEQMEKEATTYIDTIKSGIIKQAEQYQNYFALYSICSKFHYTPLLSKEVPAETIQIEYDRLLQIYIEHKKQKYIEGALQEVFMHHGFHFESVQNDNESIQYEFSMDSVSGVNLSQNSSGSFEMKFYGKCDDENVSQDLRRTLGEKNRHFCSLIPSITKELELRGIVFPGYNVNPVEGDKIEIIHTNQHNLFNDANTSTKMFRE